MAIGMDAWDMMYSLAGIFALAALPVFTFNWFRYMKAARRLPPSQKWAEFPVKSVAAFVLPILLLVGIAQVRTSGTRAQVIEQVRTLSGGYEVLVNGSPFAAPEKIIVMVKQISPVFAHHSHPTNAILINIWGADTNLVLEFRRDYDRPHEYWVFAPSHGVTAKNEIGRVTTPLLDQYP